MNQENDSQLATSESNDQAVDQDKDLDYKSLYLKEIENSKKQRTGKQSATAEVDTLNAKINKYEEDKLVREGKQSELIDKLKSENKVLTEKSTKFDSYRESEKQNILEGFPEEDREELASKDLDTLRFLKKKLGASDGKSIINNIPSISNSVRNNDMEISPLKHNSTRDEKNKWHKQMLDKFGNKGG